MAGEMSATEVTREAYPIHFAIADAFEGAEVRPFDVYQGPYIRIPGHGRFWLYEEDGCGSMFMESTNLNGKEYPIDVTPPSDQLFIDSVKDLIAGDGMTLEQLKESQETQINEGRFLGALKVIGLQRAKELIEEAEVEAEALGGVFGT